MMRKRTEEILKENISITEELLRSRVDVIMDIAGAIVAAINDGNKVLIFGNGGSAADSQHIAAELMGRFRKERRPIPAVALTTNTSIITALSNDYGYEISFKRQLQALGQAGDAVIGISTSGNAKNVYEALQAAKKMHLNIITMTGQDGGRISKLADIALKVPSKNTPRIQEAHITAGHIICELAEENFSK